MERIYSIHPYKPCLCTATEYTHLLGPYGRVRPAQANEMYWLAKTDELLELAQEKGEKIEEKGR